MKRINVKGKHYWVPGYTKEEATEWAAHFAKHEETAQLVGRMIVDGTATDVWGFAAINEPSRTRQLTDTFLVEP